VRAAVSNFIAQCLHLLPGFKVIDYYKSDGPKEFIFVSKVFEQERRQSPDNGDEPGLKVLKPHVVEGFYQCDKIVGVDFDFRMVILGDSTETSPGMLSEVCKNNIFFPVNVFFYDAQMADDVAKLAEFRTDIGQVIEV
jgi:hypothetical protein